MKSVCVIGAGSSGLIAIKYLEENGFDVTAFEKRDDIGGLWKPSDKRFSSPMHDHLCTNIPGYMMKPIDVDMPEDDQNRQLPKTDMLNYYIKYADKYKCRDKIRFETIIVNCKPIVDKSNIKSPKWEIKSKDLNTNEEKIEIYDAIFLCSGRYGEKPNIPDIPNIQNFKGRIIHSSEFKNVSEIEGKNILMVGESVSAVDLFTTFHGHVRKLYWSHHYKKFGEDKLDIFPDYIISLPDITDIDESGAIQFPTGSQQKILDDVDTIVYATGYISQAQYSFLDPEYFHIEDGIHQRLPKLHRQVIHMDYQSMYCIGHLDLSSTILAEYYVKYSVSHLLGNFELPTKEEMIKIDSDAIEALMEMGLPPKMVLYSFNPKNPRQIRDMVEALCEEGNLELINEEPLRKFHYDCLEIYVNPMFSHQMTRKLLDENTLEYTRHSDNGTSKKIYKL